MNRVQHQEPTLLGGATVVIAWAGPESNLVRDMATSVRLGARRVVVDLGDAEMVDSTTLTALKRIAAKLRAKGGRLSVVCAHPRLAGLLRLTLLTHSFDVFGSLDAALDAKT